MEKPAWAFTNVTFFNMVPNNSRRCYIFSDFGHNYDFFQFLTNDNVYYFCLNEHMKSEYNFDNIMKTYAQKCKHLNRENIIFVSLFAEQETFLKKYSLNFIHVEECKQLLHIEDELVRHFDSYNYDDAITMVNSASRFDYDEAALDASRKENVILRSTIPIAGSFVFFGASVTAQRYSYVNSFMLRSKDKTDVVIRKQGYGGCHINQAVWLVDEITNLTPTPTVCFLEWTTSVLRPSSAELKCYLDIIVNKLLSFEITPVFLYLYKTDIDNFTDCIDTYEEVANHYHISSLHFHKVIKSMKTIDTSLLLKDSCHTIFEGSNFYGSMLNKVIWNQESFPVTQKRCNSHMELNLKWYEMYHKARVVPLHQVMDCSTLDTMMFQDCMYYKVDKRIDLKITDMKSHMLIAIHVLFQKSNGYLHINGLKVQTWDRNCYYVRDGYINLYLPFEEELSLIVSQDTFNTSECKYDYCFPEEKYIWIDALIM